MTASLIDDARSQPEARREPRWGQIGNLIALFLLFFITTAPYALPAFWYDELFSFYISQMNGTTAVWQALMGGVDFNPPLSYIITRAFQAVLGNSEFVTRLPEMLGFFVMSLCLYRFVARLSTPVFGYIAAVIPWCSGVYILAAQARPYGLMLGFSALALVIWQEASWQEAGEAKRPWWALPAFSLSLCAALLTHCYAVLILIPFGLGEIVRQYRAGRFDARMWAALIAAVPCIAIYIPLLGNMKPYVTASDYFKIPWSTLPEMYEYLFRPALLWPAFISALLMTIPTLSCQSGQSNKKDGVPAHQWVVAAGFAILPGIAVLLAKMMGSQFFPRYGAAGAIGIGLLFAMHMWWRETPPRTAALVLLAFIAGHVISVGQYIHSAIADPPNSEKASLSKMERRQSPLEIRKNLPFVAASGLRFFELDHYGAPDLVSRLYYLLDADASVGYTQTNVFDKGLPLMKRWFPIRGQLVEYKQFIREHKKFLVYGNYHFANDWLFKKLIDDGAQLSLLTDSEHHLGDLMLFEVTWNPEQPVQQAH